MDIKNILLLVTGIFIIVMLLTIVIASFSNNNSFTYAGSDYAYTVYTNTSGANINSTDAISLSRIVPVFTITGRAYKKDEILRITVANTNLTNATINTVFNGVNKGNFTAVHEGTTSYDYIINCNSTLNAYTVKAYVTQKAGITLTSGNLTCATGATGGSDISGIIIVMIFVVVILIINFGLKKKK